MLVGASTAAALGFAAPANAATTAGLTAESQPNVTQGASNQSAGNLDFGFYNNFTTGATVKFQINGDDCTTQAGIDRAVGFASAPSVAISKANSTDTGRVPTYTSAVSSTGAQCGTVGIKDTFTVTLTQPSSGGNASDLFNMALSNILYNVGKTATGNVTVTATPTDIKDGSGNAMTAGQASNATIVNKSITFIPVTSATPGQQNAALGTATFTESTPGAYFPAGDVTQVNLLLSDGAYSAGVTPTIKVPSGYTVYKTAAATAADQGTPTTTASTGKLYTFYVKAPATAVAATVSVSGLKADAPGSPETVTVSTGTHPTTTPNADTHEGPFQALNVVNQARVGGENRYATAAAMFNKGPGANNYCGPFTSGGDAVLSSGQQFPDALSANFLAGDLGTGTLLTRQNTLSPEAKQALQNNCVGRVFITGGDAAVSQNVENQIESIHLNGSSLFPSIQVVRLGGANRYATNADINRYVLNHNNSYMGKTAILATGKAPYDSLAVGPVVNANGYPLVLTNGSNLNNGEVGQLQDLGINNVVIVGGTTAVSQGVQDQLSADGFNVSRVAGANRYETAAQIATWGSEGLTNSDGSPMAGVLGQSQGLTDTTTNVATGLGFADALAAGPLAGADSQTIVLSQGADTVGAGLAGYLAGKTVNEVSTLRALGLGAATGYGMMRDAAADIGY